MGVTVVDDIQEAVSTLTSRSVMERVFNDLSQLARASEHDEKWFSTLVDVINFTQDVEIGFSHAKAYALYIMQQNWEQVPLKIRMKFDNSFHQFAKSVTGKEASTIDNYVRVARIWLADRQYHPRHQIRLVVRDEAGHPQIDEKGRIMIRYVDFVPYEIDMSKLLFVSARAVRNEMTDRLWELLVDPYATCADIQIENALTAGLIDPEGDLSLRFEVVGPYLVAKENGEEAVLAEFDWESYYNDPDSLARRAIDRILMVLDIKLDETVIENQTHRRRLNEGLEM